ASVRETRELGMREGTASPPRASFGGSAGARRLSRASREAAGGRDNMSQAQSPVNYSSETLDRIARSGEAVFAIDSSDRVVLWNKKCEELLGKPARSVLGKRCDEVIGGR